MMDNESIVNLFKIKNLNWISVTVIISTIVWFILFFARIFFNIDVTSTCQFGEFILLLFIIGLTYKIWKNTKSEDSGIFICFLLSNILLVLVNILYFLVYSTPHLLSHTALFNFIVVLWDIIVITFFVKIRLSYGFHITWKILAEKRTLVTLAAFIVTDIVIFVFFSIKVHYAIGHMSLYQIMQFLKFTGDLIIFDLSILSLIYSKNTGMTLLASGYIITMSSEFMFTSGYVSNMTGLLNYCELLWFLGMIVLLWGNIKIIEDSNYNVKEWFHSTSTIKSTLTFWVFSVIFISFIGLFSLIKKFSIIDHVIFIFFPTIIMLYAMMIVYISMLIANIFEKPFKQIAANIKLLMLVDGKTKLNNNFAAEEFIFLQQFILEAFKYRDEKNQVVFNEQEKFKTTVKQMLHDIQSPLSSLGTIVAEQSINIPENTRITLRNASDRIGDITNHLLSQYENNQSLEDNSTDLLVSLAILQVMSEKRYQFNDANVEFSINFDKNANFACIKISPANFKRMLSNLINNAVEAIKDRPDGKVEIELVTNSKNVVIFIRDNGPGMPKHIREDFYSGRIITTSKEHGHGIGLMQIRDTINLYNGTCIIYTEEDVSTEIVIKFPMINTPYWIASEIRIGSDDTVIILDDDESIHGAWNSKLKPFLLQFPEIKVKHYTQGIEVIHYINSLTEEQKQQIILLTDYELLNQGMNGFDVVKHSKIHHAILVTSHVSNVQVQELVIQARIKTLPKELTSVVSIEIDKKIPKWSKCVDMVWVEDQKWFVESIISNFYNNLNIDVYYDPDSFMKNVQQYPLNTRIVLDTYYYTFDNKIAYFLDGLTIARILHNMGYTKLIIFSGEVIEPGMIPNYLTVILKSDLAAKKNLNNI